MELTASQKISLRMAVAARVREFEEYEPDGRLGDYVRSELAIGRELLGILDGAMVIGIQSYSTV